MKGMNRSTFVFSTIAALVIVTLVAVYVMGQVVIRANTQLLTEQGALELLHQILSTVKDAETGQRGYLLTGNDAYLEPYTNALRRIPDEIRRLGGQVGNSELDHDQVERLRDAITKKLTELERTIALRQTLGLDAALKVVKTDVGKNYMDDIRQQIGILSDNERWAVSEQARRSSFWEIVRTGTFTVLTLIDLAFIAWAYRRLRGESHAKDLAAAEVLRQKNLLGVTLSSIGDAVIVTDINSRIVFINDVALQLSGWTADDALGQSCEQVFNIINEHTQKAVESPVDKVLKTGVIVGLANHTLLIRKDGSTVPIDDSGSPVRDADGRMHGVVLIFRDFSVQREAANKLVQAMRDLEAANKAKDRFVAMISHELRTPLTPVLGTLTSWELGQTIPADLREDVRMLRWNVELEARLIDDLLDLTRINSGKLSLKLESADVHQYIRSVLTIFQREIEEKNLQISLALDAPRHTVHGDTARLQQVFWNILKNASKFTSKGGSIRIETHDSDNHIVVSFIDSGIGMTPDTRERIFQPFEQGNRHITQHFGGLGLGMTISKELAEAHGGKLQARSEGLGQGSTFLVTLPLVDTPAPSTPAATSSGAPASPQRRLKVLLVEDHADTATVISLLLKKIGHSVETAGSVADGVARFDGGGFDLLLSDLGLPDGSGLDVIRQIRQKSQVPAIALTGYGMDEDIARCKEAGFNAHLTKPINFQELEKLIRTVT